MELQCSGIIAETAMQCLETIQYKPEYGLGTQMTPTVCYNKKGMSETINKEVQFRKEDENNSIPLGQPHQQR